MTSHLPFQQGEDEMRCAMMAAAAACVVAAPASAANVTFDFNPNVTTGIYTFRGCCALNAQITSLVITGATPGDFVNGLSEIGVIADDGTFVLSSPSYISTDLYGRWFGHLTVKNDGKLRTPFTLVNYTISGTTAPAVPEPATWALMILGFGAVGGAMRRRHFKARSAVFS